MRATRSPEYVLLSSALQRARKQRLGCTLTTQDIVIPERCPVLGMPLRRNRGQSGDDSPTLDRIDPRRGYVPGNVQVISHLANRIKSNGTAAQVMAVGEWMLVQANLIHGTDE